MEEIGSLLTIVLRISLAPLVGYTVIRLARRWPRATLTLLLAFLAVGAGALGYAGHEGFSVALDSRKMTFGSEIGRWCYAVGGVIVILGFPALPLVAIGSARNGEDIGPVGPQWVVALFAYFMACLIWSSVLYSLLTGINK